MINLFKAMTVSSFAIPLMFAAPLVLTGCDDDQEVLEMETESGEVEVEQDPDTGAIDVETDE